MILGRACQQGRRRSCNSSQVLLQMHPERSLLGMVQQTEYPLGGQVVEQAAQFPSPIAVHVP